MSTVATLKPGRAEGCVAAPPSKSYAHRMLICAALAEGESRIQGIAQSQDMLATLDCLTALGVSWRREGDSVILQRRHNTLDGTPSDTSEMPIFPCRESGSTLRFMLPLALACKGRARCTGTSRLMERGVGIYETLFAEKGIRMQKSDSGITVEGRLPPGTYTLRGDVSSQFVTGLLFTLPLLEGDSTLCVLPPVESRLYIDITLDVLRRFGVTVVEDRPNTFTVRGQQTYRSADACVEGDWSNGAFLYALRALGGQVEVTGLDTHSLQGDRVCLACFERLRTPGAEIDISACPDLGPVLFSVAAAFGQGAVFTGTHRLRIKESDRASAMAAELKKFGAVVDVEENRVIIHPGQLHAPTAELCGHNDHRVVMSLAVLSTLWGGCIHDAQAVDKSYPDFFRVLRQLGLEVTIENED